MNWKPSSFSLVALLLSLLLSPSAAVAQQEQVKGTPAEPTDAAEVREQIATVEKLMPSLPDRGAALYVLAVSKQHLHETRQALSLLKECISLQEGFDPSGDPEFRGLKGEKEFETLEERVHRNFPAVMHAHGAMVTEEKDLVPEGLAYDERQNLFYMGSLYRRKIVKITPNSHVSDLVPADRYKLLPVLGIRLDPRDGSVWAATTDFAVDAWATELIHLDAQGNLLGRYSPKGPGKHELNDLVVRRSGEVYTTSTSTHVVFRWNPKAEAFETVATNRPLLHPNGIALADDDQTLYVADDLGVVQIHLADGSSRDVEPGSHSTLAGIDGLYWHKGSLVAVQNGIGSPRVVAFQLSKDGSRVVQTTVLENRSGLTVLPTTGAIRGDDFYFISNSQVDNLNGDRIMDVTKLEPIRIAVVRLP
jgi:DNA-binding beta-propeller fold protein YncE